MRARIRARAPTPAFILSPPLSVDALGLEQARAPAYVRATLHGRRPKGGDAKQGIYHDVKVTLGRMLFAFSVSFSVYHPQNSDGTFTPNEARKVQNFCDSFCSLKVLEKGG